MPAFTLLSPQSERALARRLRRNAEPRPGQVVPNRMVVARDDLPAQPVGEMDHQRSFQVQRQLAIVVADNH